MSENEQLPEPLTPSDCDVRELDGFMLNVERLLASELLAIATGDEFRAAVLLWCRAWKQVPAASLPDDDRVLAGFSMVPPAKWKRLKANALHGFVRCSDGRLYHRVLAPEALRAWNRKRRYRENRERDADRLKRWRERNRNGEETPPETSDETRFDTRSETPPETRKGQGQGQGQKERDTQQRLDGSLGSAKPADAESARAAACSPPDDSGDRPYGVPRLDDPPDDDPDVPPDRLMVQALDGSIVTHFGARSARAHPAGNDHEVARRLLGEGIPLAFCRDVIEAKVARRKAKGLDPPKALALFEDDIRSAAANGRSRGPTTAASKPQDEIYPPEIYRNLL